MFPKSLISGILLLGLVGTIPAIAKDKKEKEVRFNKKELARETTLPVFRNHKVVRGRKIQTEGRIELDLTFGKTLNDAFYDTFPITLAANYHLNEVHGFVLEFGTYSSSQNSFVDAVRNARGSNFNLDQVPLLESQYSLIWEYTPYYGKISFSKQRVLNLSIYTTLGYGKLNYTGDSSNVFHAGIGQKLYFSKNWGLKLDLRGKMYEFIDFPKGPAGTQAPPWEKKSTFNMELSVGLVYLFPKL